MTAYLVALLIVGSAVILGRAACRACGVDAGIAPAAGLALLIALASLGVRLPGGATVAAIVCALVIAGAALWLTRAGDLKPDWAAAAAGLMAAALTTLQFVSAGRIGLPGVSLNNDTAVHMLWAEGLRSDLMERLYASNPGYPLGPHSLMATIAQGTGIDMDSVLTGLLIAMPVLFAIVAAQVMRRVPAILRIPAAGFVGLTYLCAAWFAQGAFKEPLLALLLLGFAVGLGDLLQRGRRLGAFATVPLGLIVAASMLTYSYLAVAWLATTAVLCVTLTIALRRPRLGELASAARTAIFPVLVGCAAALVAVAVELPRMWNYVQALGPSPAGEGGIGQEELGNLAGPLPLGEALGIWPTGDFRFPPPPDAFMLDELKLAMLVAVVAATAWLLIRRRDLGLVSVLGAATIMVLLTDGRQSPYVTAKALVVLSPFVLLVVLRALLPEGGIPPTLGTRLVATGRIAIAAILVGAGLWSTQLVLRGTPVESAEHRDQLAELRPLVAAGPTLFLGADDYAGWRLREMPLGYLGVGFPAPIAVATSPEKPYQYGSALDWDSVDAATLDRFRYVVTSRGPYQSSAPPNFRRLGATPLFEAWERVGPTPRRSSLDPIDGPAATLDCRQDPDARLLSRRPGFAAIAPTSKVLTGGLPPLGPGSATSAPISLPRGPWRLAVKYTSTTTLRLQIGRAIFHELPPNTNRPGSWWPGGTLRSKGRPENLVVVAERDGRLTRSAFPASISGIVATRPGAVRIVPLRHACGRSVDWYRIP